MKVTVTEIDGKDHKTRENIINLLDEYTLAITFRSNGAGRLETIKCTTNHAKLPETEKFPPIQKHPVVVENFHQIYDLEFKRWRAFRWENIINIVLEQE